MHDVRMLDEILKKLNVPNSKLQECAFTWNEARGKIFFAKELPKALKRLDNLKDYTSHSIRRKIVAANISLEMMTEAYKQNKYEGLLNILGKDETGIAKVTKNRKVLEKL